MQNLAADRMASQIRIDSPSVGGVGSNSIAQAEYTNAGGQLPSAPSQAGSGGFADLLAHSLEGVNEAQMNADAAIKELVAGKTKNIHETMLAIEKADLSLKMMMQVRNKVLDAYREIMRMQV